MPDDWKIGVITPMPKGRASLSPGDWRPVSVLAMPNKSIERVVYKQLVDYFENNNLLLINQHGFRKGLSTSTAIMDFVQVLYQEYISCTYVDYK